MDDARFDFGDVPNWRKGGKQAVHSTYVREVEDSNVLDPHPSQLEWVLDTKGPILFDQLTRFHIDLSFAVSTRNYVAEIPAVEAVAAVPARDAVAAVPAAQGRAAVAAIPAQDAVAAVAARAAVAAVVGEWSDYTDCEAEEWQRVRLAPCWFEKFFKGWSLSYYNSQPKQHNESWFIPNELNTYFYWLMDQKLKDNLCPEPWHPGRAVPLADGKWDFSEQGAWHKYSQHLLTGNTIRFTWKPLHFWPLYQGTNDGVQAGFRPRALPVPQLGKLTIRANMADKFDNVFRVADAHVNTRRYSIEITKFRLFVEEARLNPVIERTLFPASRTKQSLFWPGICKVMRNEIIAGGSFIHTIKFEEVVYPEIILIFALNKTVTAGSDKYQNHTAGQPHFLQHSIEQVNLKYGTFATSMSWPDFGTVGDVNAERAVMRGYQNCGAFGMKVDPAAITIQSVQNGFALTEFPHVVLHLVETDGLKEGQPRARTLPLQTDPGLVQGKERDLVLDFKFYTQGGAPENASFIIYLGYTDTAMMYKDKNFSSPYGIH